MLSVRGLVMSKAGRTHWYHCGVEGAEESRAIASGSVERGENEVGTTVLDSPA